MLHLLEARNLQQSDLEKVLGSREMAAKIMNGECAIAREQAESLGKFIHVDPSLFLLN
ncbi:MAG: hypothetical protein AB4290_18865 [Spirulina sp.]